MSQLYVYPAIFYKDSESDGYSVAFADIDVFTEGNSLEDAYKNAKEFLFAYIKCSMKVYGEVEAPSCYEKIKSENEKELVMLVDAMV